MYGVIQLEIMTLLILKKNKTQAYSIVVFEFKDLGLNLCLFENTHVYSRLLSF